MNLVHKCCSKLGDPTGARDFCNALRRKSSLCRGVWELESHGRGAAAPASARLGRNKSALKMLCCQISPAINRLILEQSVGKSDFALAFGKERLLFLFLIFIFIL